MSRRILLLGASGQVGRAIAIYASQTHGIDMVAASRSHQDPSLRFALDVPPTIFDLIGRARPDHVILSAASTNVAWCEAYPDESRLANVAGVAATARACLAVGSTLTFISSDYVFDGIRGPAGEVDPTNPINEYGHQKRAAEVEVLAQDPANLIVRTCQVFGIDPRRANYVARIADRLRANEAVEAAGESFLSRYDLALAVARAFGHTGARIAEVRTNQPMDDVRRPRNAGLRNDRLHAEGLDPMMPLDRALELFAAAGIAP